MKKPAFYPVAFVLTLFSFTTMKAQQVDTTEILKQIVSPVFPAKHFNVLDYGARNNTAFDSRPAITKAIAACSEAGGGTVIIPAGNYYVAGPLVLKSHVNLHLDDGAVVNFSYQPNDYTPFVRTFWEGTELYNYSPLVYAYQQTDIALTGKGTLNGNAGRCFATWRPQRSEIQNKLRQMGIDQVPVEQRNFGKESNLPPSMIQFVECSNILIEDVHILDSPFWVIHPVLCNNVTVRGITTKSYNLNNDGCDPEYTRNVLIENCTFSTGDDAIAIKAGRDQDGWRIGQPSENIIIRHCVFNSNCNGLCIGSEMAAGVQNIFMENVTIKNCLNGIYFKSNPDRGGFIRNVWVRNIAIDSVRTALIRFETNYHGARGGFHPSEYTNFLIEDVRSNRSGNCGFYAVGIKNFALKDITLRNVNLQKCKTPYVLQNTENVIFRNVSMGGTQLPEHPEETPDIHLDSN